MNNYYKEIKDIVLEIESSSRVREIIDNEKRLKGYWNIGKLIVEAQGKEKRAKYGNKLIKEWAIKLEREFGKHYHYTNLARFRQFYLIFPNIDTVCQQLS